MLLMYYLAYCKSLWINTMNAVDAPVRQSLECPSLPVSQFDAAVRHGAKNIIKKNRKMIIFRWDIRISLRQGKRITLHFPSMDRRNWPSEAPVELRPLLRAVYLQRS